MSEKANPSDLGIEVMMSGGEIDAIIVAYLKKDGSVTVAYDGGWVTALGLATEALHRIQHKDLEEDA